MYGFLYENVTVTQSDTREVIGLTVHFIVKYVKHS